mgnify:CR=1 FL=1
MDLKEKALALHKQWNGKLSTEAKSPVKSREDLSIAYTPGVAEPCKVIAEDPSAAYTYTMKANTVAVISDGSAVLGLGNIGALAAMPVMEGKCVLFKEFANVNAIPIVLDTQDTEEIICTIANIAPTFGGINLEDISAPRCFEIEERLKSMLDIPVFHDDQNCHRCTGWYHQCPARYRQTERNLPRRCKRCRFCRYSHHKITAYLWIQTCDYV